MRPTRAGIGGLWISEHRLEAIARQKGIADFSGIDLWNLRGFATDFSVLIPKILSRVKDERYALIVLDPIYKGLGKRDENKAGDIASLCNEIEQLAVQSGAAVVFGAHYSKGNQAGKEAIDRIGGSGVFARDPDAILTMTPHEEKDAYVIDLTLRALPQLDAFVVRWSSCLFQRDATADATRIKTATPGKRPQNIASYKSGSVAAKYGSLLTTMPPLTNDHDASLSAVVGFVCDIIAGVVCKRLEVSPPTYHRWRQEYGGAKEETVKRLKALEKENTQLKKLVANQALDLSILKEMAEGKW